MGDQHQVSECLPLFILNSSHPKIIIAQHNLYFMGAIAIFSESSSGKQWKVGLFSALTAERGGKQPDIQQQQLELLLHLGWQSCVGC